MISINYAMREDPISLFLLEDAGKTIESVTQIVSFQRRLIRPDFLNQYYFVDPLNRKFDGEITELAYQLQDANLQFTYQYVVRVDTQVEFRNDYSVISNLCKNFMPAWGVKAYLDYLGDNTSGILVFLKFYKVSQVLNPRYLIKGNKGSSTLVRLYDEDDNLISLGVDGLKPVVSPAKFKYIKNEILHLLKINNAFIAEYDVTDVGIQNLIDRVSAEKVLQQASYNSECDIDGTLDMAQLDYDAIFDGVLKVCPQMGDMISYVRGIRPAQKSEYDYLLEDIHMNGANAVEAEQRVFDMSVRVAVKNALYYYESYGVDIEDAFQEACIGILYAIQKHTENVESLFPSYASMWMQQRMGRELHLYQYNVYMPVHYKDKILNIVAVLTKYYGQSILMSMSHEGVAKVVKKHVSCDDDEAKRIALILIPFFSLDYLLEKEENGELFSDHNQLNDKMFFDLTLLIVDNALAELPPKERDILERRYGFKEYREMTLEEVGTEYGLTRERIRQIEVRAKQKIAKYLVRKEYISRKVYRAAFKPKKRKKI